MYLYPTHGFYMVASSVLDVLDERLMESWWEGWWESSGKAERLDVLSHHDKATSPRSLQHIPGGQILPFIGRSSRLIS